MNVSRAFDGFEAALKCMRAAEIAALGAREAQKNDAAQDLAACLGDVRDASIQLWALPARGPTDLVLKARALRWHFPDGVEISDSARLGGEPPTQDAPLGEVAVHYIVRDLLALSE
ncbi:MAG TPA: hypothetical protein PKA55_14035 [Rhodoblastus sp.]|nr:hypothetical protein [Rhodoblastus sp.]